MTRTGEITLLLRLRVRTAVNGVRFAPPAHRRVGVLLALGSVLFFLVVAAAFGGLLSATRAQSELLMHRLIERAVFFLFLFLLAGGIPFVSGVLLTPGDLPLLANAPVRPASVVAARLVDAVWAASGQFVVIGVPLLVASVGAVGAGVVGWLLFVPLLALFLILPALLVAALLLLLARTLGLRRVRAAVALASAVLSVVMCLVTVSEFSQRAAQGGGAGGWSGLRPEDVPPVPPGLPTTWVSDALLALGADPAGALFPLLLLGLAAFAAFALCLLLGGPVLVGESLLEGDGAAPRRSATGAALNGLARLLPLPPAERALVAKDLRYVARDLVLLSQLGVPIILFFVPFVIGARVDGGDANARADLLYLSVGIVGTIVYMETSILGLSSVGLEGRAFWMLKAAPLAPGAVVRAKWLGATAVSLAVAVPLYAVACLFYRAPPVFWSLGLPVAVVATTALCGLGVGVSGLFPRFVYENPAHRASLSALVWGFVGASGYVLLAALLVGGGLFAGAQWPERAALFRGAGLALFGLLSLFAAVLPLLAARARLAAYAWEE